MANVIIDDVNLKNIANSIRQKNKLTDTYKPNEMAQAILDIVSGGGEIQVIIPETTVELVAVEGTPLPDGWVMCNAPVFLTETPSLVDSQTYKLTIDSTTYDMQVANNGGMWLGGNVGLMQGGTDNGEDYIFQLGEFQGSPTLMLFLKGEAGTHTVKLEFNQSEIDNLENLIDESGVLDSTEGSVSDKVEQLIGKANDIKAFEGVPTARALFRYTKNFPSKATVNLPYVYDVYQAFAYWNTAPIPIVEELTVNAPSISVSNNQYCMGQMFTYNNGVKKVILNMPNESQYMASTFAQAKILEEIVLNFSTKNIKDYSQAFGGCNKLKKIVGVLDFSSATTIQYTFDNCTNLGEVTFAPNTLSISLSLASSSKLTNESKESIFNGLAQLEEGVTKTLTLHKNVNILQSQVDGANAKGWTIVGGTVVGEEEYYG